MHTLQVGDAVTRSGGSQIGIVLLVIGGLVLVQWPGLVETVIADAVQPEVLEDGRRIDRLSEDSLPASTRTRITEAANWLRAGAPGRALEVLEKLL